MSEFIQAAKENLEFLAVCLLIVAGTVALAGLAQRLLAKDRHRLSSTRTVAFVGIFSAIAAVLMYIEIPLFFAPPFYQIDFSEVPVLIAAFYLGPVAGVVSEFVKVVLKLLLKGTSTFFVGDFANFVVGCAFVLPACMVYHYKKSKKSALWGLGLGTLCMTVFGSLFNAVYLLPKYAVLYGMPLDALIAMGTEVNSAINNVSTFVLLAVVPFNIVKGVVVSVITLLLYKRIERLLHT